VPPVPAPTTIQDGYPVRFEGHLGQRRFGDVVVAAPVRGPLSVGELAEEVPIQLGGEPGRELRNRCRVIDQMAPAALALDERDLGRAGCPSHHRDERHPISRAK
jgi:hypothetical protein